MSSSESACRHTLGVSLSTYVDTRVRIPLSLYIDSGLKKVSRFLKRKSADRRRDREEEMTEEAEDRRRIQGDGEQAKRKLSGDLEDKTLLSFLYIIVLVLANTHDAIGDSVDSKPCDPAHLRAGMHENGIEGKKADLLLFGQPSC